jgi:hypothetical protein
MESRLGLGRIRERSRGLGDPVFKHVVPFGRYTTVVTKLLDPLVVLLELLAKSIDMMLLLLEAGQLSHLIDQWHAFEYCTVHV